MLHKLRPAPHLGPAAAMLHGMELDYCYCLLLLWHRLQRLQRPTAYGLVGSQLPHGAICIAAWGH